MRTAQKIFLTFLCSSACILFYQYQLSRARYISQDLDRASGDIEVLKYQSNIKKLLSSVGGAENTTPSTTTTTTTTTKQTNDNTIAQIKRQTSNNNNNNVEQLRLANTNFHNENTNDGNRCTCDDDHKDATNSEKHVIILLFLFFCQFLFLG